MFLWLMLLVAMGKVNLLELHRVIHQPSVLPVLGLTLIFSLVVGYPAKQMRKREIGREGGWKKWRREVKRRERESPCTFNSNSNLLQSLLSHNILSNVSVLKVLEESTQVIAVNTCKQRGQSSSKRVYNSLHGSLTLDELLPNWRRVVFIPVNDILLHQDHHMALSLSFLHDRDRVIDCWCYLHVCYTVPVPLVWQGYETSW